MAANAGTDRSRTSEDGDDGVERTAGKPGILDDVAHGRVKPSDVQPGTDEARELEKQERGALDWLLSAEQPPDYEVEVQTFTPDGFKPLVFVVSPVDGRKIVQIEDRNTKGEGIRAKLDEIANCAELVALATTVIEDPATGRQIDPHSEEWRGPIPSNATAMERRFARQAGLLVGIATEIRKISGYNSEHVGKARTRTRAVSTELTSAVGGS